MPFPVIDRSRYWAYAGGITSLLVQIHLVSSSTPITTTSSPPTSVTAPSEPSSPSSSPSSSLMLTLHIANRSSRSISSTSTATSEPRSLSSRTSISSTTPVSPFLLRCEESRLVARRLQGDPRQDLQTGQRQRCLRFQGF